MKKGLFGIEKLGSIILISVILVILLIGGGSLLWKSGKSGIKFIDSWLEGFAAFPPEIGSQGPHGYRLGVGDTLTTGSLWPARAQKI